MSGQGRRLNREDCKARHLAIFRAFQGGADFTEICDRFGMARSSVCRIVREQSWRTGEPARPFGKRPPPNRKREGPLCKHCRGAVATRPRGLCDTCYYTPGVREEYATASKYAPSEVADYLGASKEAKSPTDALPGTEAKVAALAERARLGLSLWHRRDADPDAQDLPPGLRGRGDAAPEENQDEQGEEDFGRCG